MALKTKIKEEDVRDVILNHLEEIERPLAWLSKKANISYPTMYSVFKHRTFKLSQENLKKINQVLGTKF